MKRFGFQLSFQILLTIFVSFLSVSKGGSRVMSPVLLPGGKLMVAPGGDSDISPMVVPVLSFKNPTVSIVGLTGLTRPPTTIFAQDYRNPIQSLRNPITAESNLHQTVVHPNPSYNNFMNRYQQLTQQQSSVQSMIGQIKQQQQKMEVEESIRKLLVIIKQQKSQLDKLAASKDAGKMILVNSGSPHEEHLKLRPEDGNPEAPNTIELVHAESNETITYGPIIKTTKIICDERKVFKVKIIDVRVASGKVCPLKVVKTENCEGPDPILHINPNLPKHCDGLLNFLNAASGVVQVMSSIPKKLVVFASELAEAHKQHLVYLNEKYHFYDPETFGGEEEKEPPLPAEYTTSTIIKSVQ